MASSWSCPPTPSRRPTPRSTPSGPACGCGTSGSKNGTFLNRALVEDAALGEGDVLHFADFEFRLGRSDVADPAPSASPEERPTTVVPKRRELPHRFAEGTREIRELLREGQVTMVFQPIVLLSRGTVAAYEALGRGRHPDLDESPLELLRIAESIGAEAELSRLFRRKAVELTARRTDLPTIFLNTHPVELARPGSSSRSRSCGRSPPSSTSPSRSTRASSRVRPPSRSCGRCCSSATSPSPTTTSGRARRACSSWRKRRPTT